MATKSQGLPKNKRTSGGLKSASYSSNPLSHIASQPPLRDRLRRWIATETSEAVAGRFFPLVERTLRDLGYDLQAAAPKEKARQAKEKLRAADVTPSLMQRAADGAERAAAADQSAREWFEAVQRRAYSEEVAEQAFARGLSMLNEKPPVESGDSGEPPTPEQVFAFLLAWEELGGSSGVAAIRELLRQGKGNLPTN